MLHAAPIDQTAEITTMLGAARAGDRSASDKLVEAVYSDLRRIAHRVFSGERPDNTLQPTALVHEAWLRLFDGNEPDYQDRVHFYAVAARQMRHLLIQHGREFHALKRGGGLKVVLDERIHGGSVPGFEFGELEELLGRLERTDPEAARVVELKFFSGMTDGEVAAALGRSHSTVRRHWKFAQAWLASRMAGQPGANEKHEEKIS